MGIHGRGDDEIRMCMYTRTRVHVRRPKRKWGRGGSRSTHAFPRQGMRGRRASKYLSLWALSVGFGDVIEEVQAERFRPGGIDPANKKEKNTNYVHTEREKKNLRYVKKVNKKYRLSQPSPPLSLCGTRCPFFFFSCRFVCVYEKRQIFNGRSFNSTVFLIWEDWRRRWVGT